MFEIIKTSVLRGRSKNFRKMSFHKNVRKKAVFADSVRSERKKKSKENFFVGHFSLTVKECRKHQTDKADLIPFIFFYFTVSY